MEKILGAEIMSILEEGPIRRFLRERAHTHSSPSPATYYFDLPTTDKAVELEGFLTMVREGKARIRLVDRADYRVRVEAEIL